MIPALVLFAGLFSEGVAVRAVAQNTSQDAAETATPRPPGDTAQRQEGLSPKGHTSVVVDLNIRRKQPAAPDTDVDPPALVPTSVVQDRIAVRASFLQVSMGGSTRPYSSAAPRAPPA